MKRFFLSSLIVIVLAACSENEEGTTNDANTENDDQTAEQVESGEASTSSNEEFIGLGEARLGDTYEEFVEAFGEDTSDTEGIGFFQNESIWINYNDTLTYTVVLHFEGTDQVDRSKEEVDDLIQAVLPEDSQFEREEMDEEEELFMLHYTSDQLEATFHTMTGHLSDRTDYREVRADLVPSEENENRFSGIVFSSN